MKTLASFAPVGLITSILFIALLFFVAYLIIQAAVRNGIDNSELGKQLKQKMNTDQHEHK
ncbi:hypothetical protein ACLIBH_10675 [Virgibacillus sp. W0430]|uniref:hypothetical protein n=1 Tax=Virgibacillus sp. W0430 TaxID=3391580 RepID=UPI003F46CBE1